MKKLNKLSFVILFVFILFISGCSNPKKEFEEDYQMFKDVDHVFYKANYKDVYHALTRSPKYSVILFAYDPNLAVCPFCIEVLPILNEAAIAAGVEEILYLDIRSMRVERNAEYLSLIDYITKQVDDLETRNDQLEIIVPDVYLVQNGKILGHHIATLKDEEGKYRLDLDSQGKAELIEIYRNIFKKIK